MTATNPQLPDFTRWQWSDTVTREWYKPLFEDASRAYLEIERESVAHGLRAAAWQNVTIPQLVELSHWAHMRGLVVVPTNAVASSGTYSTTSQPGSDVVRVVITHPKHYADVLPWNDNQKIGDFLGFPPCCRDAFDATWGKGQVDSTYDQATARRHVLSTTLLRWMGVRMVPHMPCSNACEASYEMANRMFTLGCTLGYTEQMFTIREALGWPVKGSRLFGISELTFPALRLVTRTDWTPTTETFSYSGNYNYPKAWMWKDNGFSSRDAMWSAHAPLLASLKEELAKDARLLDLGCGNGLLLGRLTIRRPDVRIAGVDANPIAIQHAKSQLLLGKWYSQKIEDSADWSEWNPTAVLINPVRLVEMGLLRAARVRTWLKTVPQVFVYAYSDAQGTLEELVAQAGFTESVRMLQRTPDVSVGIL